MRPADGGKIYEDGPPQRLRVCIITKSHTAAVQTLGDLNSDDSVLALHHPLPATATKTAHTRTTAKHDAVHVEACKQVVRAGSLLSQGRQLASSRPFHSQNRVFSPSLPITYSIVNLLSSKKAPTPGSALFVIAFSENGRQSLAQR